MSPTPAAVSLAGDGTKVRRLTMVRKQGADGDQETEVRAFLHGLEHGRKTRWKRCGTRKRDDATTFSFEDGTGLMEWVAPGRALVTFHAPDDVAAKHAALKDLVRRWMIATSGSG
jgi:hypothetical protein